MHNQPQAKALSPEGPLTIVAPSQIGGRGVFARQPIAAGIVIEIAPVLIVPLEQARSLMKTLLFHYFFRWSESSQDVAVCLGFGSLYNHSSSPNAAYVRDFTRCQIIFRALRNIAAGEEIVTDYHSGRTNDDKFNFEIDEQN
jgi:SET domain-containing protein